jgi:hypothetical protein
VRTTGTWYQRCGSQEFIGSDDACLDVPELLDLLSDLKAINIEVQNQSDGSFLFGHGW